MRRLPCVVSAAEHAGWAYLISVAPKGAVPAVIDRRRVMLITPGLPLLPYDHDTRAMSEEDADALLTRVRRSIAARTSVAMERLVTDLAPAYACLALAIREPPFADLPKSVAAVRASYRLQCAADGMLYQRALCRAARRLRLDVNLCRRGDETSRAARSLAVPRSEIDEFITRTGRPPGPPWTGEHRRAFAAGIAALSAHTRRPLSISSGS